MKMDAGLSFDMVMKLRPLVDVPTSSVEVLLPQSTEPCVIGTVIAILEVPNDIPGLVQKYPAKAAAAISTTMRAPETKFVYFIM